MVIPPKDTQVLAEVLSVLGEHGYDGFGNAMEIVLNTARLVERTEHLS